MSDCSTCETLGSPHWCIYMRLYSNSTKLVAMPSKYFCHSQFSEIHHLVNLAILLSYSNSLSHMYSFVIKFFFISEYWNISCLGTVRDRGEVFELSLMLNHSLTLHSLQSVFSINSYYVTTTITEKSIVVLYCRLYV